MGFGNEEDAGNKNQTFKRIYAKPQRLALNLGLDSIEYQQIFQEDFQQTFVVPCNLQISVE